MRYLALLFCIITGLYADAQQLSNLRIKKLPVADSLNLDTLYLVPASVKVSYQGRLLQDQTHYRVNYTLNRLYLLNLQKGDSVDVQYRVFQADLKKVYRRKDTSLIASDFMMNKNPFSFNGPEESNNPFRSDGLQLNGSFSRGISFGNNQNLVVNSYLNLQVSGKLNNEIDVLAAISDDNNPIQPEGNTQQLQDFDKIYIQFSKDKSRLTIGDFQMLRPDRSYFMNYNKKSRGAQFNTETKIGRDASMRLQADAAVSRGRFARNIINGQEGNLGPYRLTGANGEQYIIIISGTEVVYVDGRKLTRGEQNDYVIDYNSGEVVFMPRVLITTYTRIVIEFQYSDRNYARSVFHLNDEIDYKKLRIRLNYFSEQDNKNQPFQQDLSNEDKLTLKNAGDQINNAYTSSAQRVSTFNSNLILYRKIDSLGYSGIYLFSNDAASDTVFYQVAFSFVGQGKGNYIQAASSANGRVYQWVAPLNGVPQGSFEPVLPLVSPKRMQMFSVGTDYNLNKHTVLSAEGALSNYDKNTFSDKDKNNDQGYGLRLQVNNKTFLRKKDEQDWHLKTEANYEYVDKNFRYVERYRNIEFNRIWNRQLQNLQEADTSFEEHILNFKTGLFKSSLFNLNYQTALYNRDAVYKGVQHMASTQLNYKKNRFSAEREWVNTENSIKEPENSFRHEKVDYARALPYVMAGIRYEHDESRFRDTTDQLQSNSYMFRQVQYYIEQADSSKVRFKADYTQRLDYLPRANRFVASTDGRIASMNTEWNNNSKRQRLLLNVTYREFIIKDTGLVKNKAENSLLSRLEYDYQFLKKVFVASTYYQVGSGQELVRDYQYVEVRAGQGVYAWYDFNNNGLQENNEFVIAPFPNQANYIKIFLPTNTFIRTNTNQFNQTLNINPSEVWYNRRGLKKFIADLSSISAIRIDRKILNQKDLNFLNPFELRLNDTALVSVASDLRQTLFYKRSDPSFGMDYNWLNSRSKTLLTNGFDSRLKTENNINIRWTPNMSWGYTLGYSLGKKTYRSEFFNNNNYNYSYSSIQPKVSYQPKQNFRITMLLTYSEASNVPELGNEQAFNKELGLELRYNIPDKGAFSTKVNYIDVHFNGAVNSPIGFDMLQGLQNGQNMTWNLSYQQRLSNNIQINLNYDGRKSQGFDTVHVARLEARYLF